MVISAPVSQVLLGIEIEESNLPHGRTLLGTLSLAPKVGDTRLGPQEQKQK